MEQLQIISEYLKKVNFTYSNISVIVAELFFIICLIIIINTLLFLLKKYIIKISYLKKFENIISKNYSFIKKKISLLGLLSSIILVLFNGWLIYEKHDLLKYYLDLLYSIPKEFWIESLKSTLKLILAVYLYRKFKAKLFKTLELLKEKAKNFDKLTSNDEAVEKFFINGYKIINVSVIYIIFYFFISIFKIPIIIATYTTVIYKIFLTLMIAKELVIVSDFFISTFDGLYEKYSPKYPILKYYLELKKLVPIARKYIEYSIYVYGASLILSFLKFKFTDQISEFGPKIIELIGIFFLSRVAVEVMKLFLYELFFRNKSISDSELKRRKTMQPILTSTLGYTIYFSAMLLGLKVIDINPIPILAGAGILGLVIGLGAQKFINDFIAGFLIIFEEHFLVGDFVEVKDAKGLVEEVNIMVTKIRNIDGQLHIIKNGDIGEIINHSKHYTNAVVKIGVGYESNLDFVYSIIEKAGKKLKESNKDILDFPVVEGLESFEDAEQIIRIVTKVLPGKHITVSQNFRKILKEMFDENNIRLPYARRVFVADEEEILKLKNIIENK
ncbi:MAG: mechanosensitive ion channel family protein [Leptospiraceae bacterium]|nr:mechanosensitive ion channel family protein [Leptospiraceae bacterium]MCP5497118.1 mechanosensitive ion channel family protein [Leptospiraceae bacterium]